MANELHTLKIGNTSYPVVPQQVYLTGKADNVNYPLVFATAIGSSTAGSASNQTLLTDTANSLYYNPSTNALTASKFIGALEGKASSATVADSAGTASSVAWTGVTGKPTTFTPSEHTHDYLPLSGGTLTSNAIAPLMLTSTEDSGHSILQFSSGTTYLGALGFKGQNDPYFRDSRGGNYPLIHSGNIGSYNAGSATKLQTARTIWGQSFDGTGNVSGNLNLSTSKVYWGDASWYYIGSKEDSSSIPPHGEYKFYSGHRFFVATGEALRINSSGNVLIGTTTDNGAKLQVNGAGKFEGAVTAPTFNGNLNGSASKVNGYSVSVVSSMPSSPDANTIYYVV